MSFADGVAQMHEDLLEEFGSSVTYEPAGGAAFAVTVIWKERTGEISAWCRLSAFAAEPRKNDTIVRGGHRYRVAGDEPVKTDGAGGVTLALRLVGAA